jgi:hypothetical protein
MSHLKQAKLTERVTTRATTNTRDTKHHPRSSDLELDLLSLQYAAGNQAVTRLLQPHGGDEQGADQVAEQVMHMADPVPFAADNEDKEKSPLMRQQSGEPGANTATQSPDVPPIVHEVLNSGSGQPLDVVTRAFMESRFGHDFSQVRVYTDEQAAESARAVNALAYTVGSNIVFGEGEHALGTDEGRRLLAHELTHVLQQSSYIPHTSQSYPQLQRKEKERPKRDAETAEMRAVSNRPKVRETLPLLQRFRGDIPLYLLLGWIDVESSGKVTAEMHNKQDEISYFQIPLDDRQRMHFDKPGDREKLIANTKEGREFAIKVGIADVKLNEKYLQSLGVTRDPNSETYWKLVKLVHTIGIGEVRTLFRNMKKDLDSGTSTVDPIPASWDEIKEHIQASTYSNRSHLLERFGAVDFVIMVGRNHEEALVPQSPE